MHQFALLERFHQDQVGEGGDCIPLCILRPLWQGAIMQACTPFCCCMLMQQACREGRGFLELAWHIPGKTVFSMISYVLMQYSGCFLTTEGLSELRCDQLLQEAGNVDVQVALGVLRSLARQYDAAGEAFRYGSQFPVPRVHRTGSSDCLTRLLADIGLRSKVACRCLG